MSPFEHAKRGSMTPQRLCSAPDCSKNGVRKTDVGWLCNSHALRYKRYGRLHKQEHKPHYYERRAWANMNSRCNNPKTPGFNIYGGRGIKVLYDTFESFFADIGPRPSTNHSVDRVDVNGHYAPGNCRWATRIQQGNNARSNILISYAGRTQTLTEWSREIGVKTNTLQYRLRRGWTVERAIGGSNG